MDPKGRSEINDTKYSVLTMNWIIRERVKVDRVACPWLIKKFLDKEAEFVFVPATKVMDEAQRLGATPFDVAGVELGHHGKESSFQAIVKKYGLSDDLALVSAQTPTTRSCSLELFDGNRSLNVTVAHADDTSSDVAGLGAIMGDVEEGKAKLRVEAEQFAA
jgi:hypothetical protein